MVSSNQSLINNRCFPLNFITSGTNFYNPKGSLESKKPIDFDSIPPDVLDLGPDTINLNPIPSDTNSYNLKDSLGSKLESLNSNSITPDTNSGNGYFPYREEDDESKSAEDFFTAEDAIFFEGRENKQFLIQSRDLSRFFCSSLEEKKSNNFIADFPWGLFFVLFPWGQFLSFEFSANG